MRSPKVSKKAKCHLNLDLALPLDQQHMLTSLAAGKNMEAICVIYMNEVSGNYIQTSSGKCMAENLKGKIHEQL